jgi:outer membrane protein assembly factor BamB
MKAWICFSLSVLALAAATAADSPQWRGINRDGMHHERIATNWPAEGPKVVWKAAVGTGFSSVSISNGRAYTMGNTEGQDTIWCLDAATGKEVWKHTYAARLDPQYYEGGPGATPTVDRDRVYTISKWGDVFCLDAANGKIVWQRDLRQDGFQTNRWGFAGSPLILGDLVLLNTGIAGTALNRNTGKIVWLNGTTPAGYASPTLCRDGDRAKVLIFGAKALYALEPDNGLELWQYPFETGYQVNDTDPLIHRGKIFITSYNKGCALLDPADGKAVYANKNLNTHLSPGIVFGDYLYAFNGEAKTKTDFRCLHVPSGELKWTRKDPAFGSMIGVENRLLVLSEKGDLILAEATPEDFKPVASAKILTGTCWSPPSLANGFLYARNAKGDLVCLDLRP